jgi:hypothetical protein
VTGPCEHALEYSRSADVMEFTGYVRDLLAPEEGHCPMELAHRHSVCRWDSVTIFETL